MLKVLDVEGAVSRNGTRWFRTDAPWSYDHDRLGHLRAQRLREQQAMITYQGERRCRLRFLREQLDDHGATDCGRCNMCRGTAGGRPATEGPAEEDLAAARRFLRSTRPSCSTPASSGPGLDERRGNITRRTAGRSRAVRSPSEPTRDGPRSSLNASALGTPSPTTNCWVAWPPSSRPGPGVVDRRGSPGCRRAGARCWSRDSPAGSGGRPPRAGRRSASRPPRAAAPTRDAELGHPGRQRARRIRVRPCRRHRPPRWAGTGRRRRVPLRVDDGRRGRGAARRRCRARAAVRRRP